MNRQLSEQEKARVARWRKQVEAWIVALQGDGTQDGKVPAAWLEEIEGRPLSEVIIDRLCEVRGIGVDGGDNYHRYVDDRYDREGARRRNNHDREIALDAVSRYLRVQLAGLVGDELHGLVRRFYRRGDVGLDAAVRRAVVVALGTAQGVTGSGIRWPEAAERSARESFARMTEAERAAIQRKSEVCGCAPWEIVADGQAVAADRPVRVLA